MSEEDNNEKQTKQAVDLLMLQQKAQDYQNKVVALGNKEYQGKYQGLSIRMKGDGTILEVRIDQGFYETASKAQMEQAFLTLSHNLHTAIVNDQTALQEEFKIDFGPYKDLFTNGTN